MTEIFIKAYAKLNLCLDITGREQSGYHFLDGVMLSIDWCDILRLSLRDEGGISVVCGVPGIPSDDTNTAAKAARLFFEYTKKTPGGLLIEIEKNIPSKAGLGGGSADAAATLIGLNYLFKNICSDTELEKIGLTVGADVPFCLRAGCARARGRGELLDPLPLPPNCYFLIAKPDAGMSTGQAFEKYDHLKSVDITRPDVSGMINALQAGDLKKAGSLMRNVFEEVVSLPEVSELKSDMLKHGALGACMTGSGTAVAGMFASYQAAFFCSGAIGNKAGRLRIVRPWGAAPTPAKGRIPHGEYSPLESHC